MNLVLTVKWSKMKLKINIKMAISHTSSNEIYDPGEMITGLSAVFDDVPCSFPRSIRSASQLWSILESFCKCQIHHSSFLLLAPARLVEINNCALKKTALWWVIFSEASIFEYSSILIFVTDCLSTITFSSLPSWNINGPFLALLWKTAVKHCKTISDLHSG